MVIFQTNKIPNSRDDLFDKHITDLVDVPFYLNLTYSNKSEDISVYERFY